MQKLSELESRAIVNALVVARDQFHADAILMALGGDKRAVQAFNLQAEQAERLAERCKGYRIALVS